MPDEPVGSGRPGRHDAPALPAWATGLAAGLIAESRRARMLVAGLLIAAALLLAAGLALPGRTVVSQFLADHLIFFDGAARVAQGQSPHVDFESPLGPLFYWGLWLGLELGGSFGAMLPVATALFLLVFTPLTLHAGLSRLPPWAAALLGLTLLLLSAAPFFIGDVVPKPTFAMFYNRWCYALLCLLPLFALPPRHERRPVLDGLVIATVWLLTFYLKTTFAVLGAVLLLGLLWFRHARRSAALGIGLAASGVLVVELLWGGTGQYLGDVRSAAAATGALRDGPLGLLATVSNNALGIYLYLAVLLLALLDRVRWDYLLVALFAGGAGIVLDRFNSQGPGLPPLLAGALVALFAPRLGRPEHPPHGRAVLGGALLAGAIAVPLAVPAFASLAFHVFAASRADVTGIQGTALNGLVMQGPPTSTQTAQVGATVVTSPCGSLSPQPLIEAPTQSAGASDAMMRAALSDATELLRDPRLTGGVLSFDVINPFGAVLNRPAVGPALVDFDVNASDKVHPPAVDAFQGVDVVLIPAHPHKPTTSAFMRRVYGRYLLSNYRLTARTACWDAYTRRN